MNKTIVTMTGFIASDIRLTSTTQLVGFVRIAVNRQVYDKISEEWVTKPTTFYQGVIKDQLALEAAGHLKKGDPIIAYGYFQTRQTGNEERLEFIIEDIGKSIRGPDD